MAAANQAAGSALTRGTACQPVTARVKRARPRRSLDRAPTSWPTPRSRSAACREVNPDPSLRRTRIPYVYAICVRPTLWLDPWQSSSMARPRVIDRRLVLEASLAIADADGLDAVTMGAVARRLGVTPMALYRHVANKGDLLDGVVESLLDEIPTPAEGA